VTGWTVGDEEGGERVEVPAEPSSASRRDEGVLRDQERHQQPRGPSEIRVHIAPSDSKFQIGDVKAHDSSQREVCLLSIFPWPKLPTVHTQ
jgi:hypothetical protein